MGFDQRGAEGWDFRRLRFDVDGQSLIKVTLTGVNTGRVRVCLSRDDADNARECDDMHAGTLSRAVFDGGRTTWSVELVGLASAPGQFGTIRLEFNALSVDLHLGSVRFNGTDDPYNNGFLVLFGDKGSADGAFDFHAEMAGISGSHPWHYNLAVEDLPLAEQSGGPSSSVDFNAPISGGTKYNLLFENTEASAATPSLVDARLTWP